MISMGQNKTNFKTKFGLDERKQTVLLIIDNICSEI